MAEKSSGQYEGADGSDGVQDAKTDEVARKRRSRPEASETLRTGMRTHPRTWAEAAAVGRSRASRRTDGWSRGSRPTGRCDARTPERRRRRGYGRQNSTPGIHRRMDHRVRASSSSERRRRAPRVTVRARVEVRRATIPTTLSSACSEQNMHTTTTGDAKWSASPRLGHISWRVARWAGIARGCPLFGRRCVSPV